MQKPMKREEVFYADRSRGMSNQTTRSEDINRKGFEDSVPQKIGKEVEELSRKSSLERPKPAFTANQEPWIRNLILYGIGLLVLILALGCQNVLGTWERDKKILVLEETVFAQKQEIGRLKDALKELKEGLFKNIGVRESLCYVGLKSGAIPDSAFTASSRWNDHEGERLARLDNKKNGNSVGAWCSRYSIVGQWIQVDLGDPTLLAGVITQGRMPNGNQFVKSYKVACGND